VCFYVKGMVFVVWMVVHGYSVRTVSCDCRSQRMHHLARFQYRGNPCWHRVLGRSDMVKRAVLLLACITFLSTCSPKCERPDYGVRLCITIKPAFM
jgi:hypothetical protein